LTITPSGGDVTVAGTFAYAAANRPTEVVMYPVSQFVSSPDGADNQVTVYLASDRTNRRAFMRFVGLENSQDMDMDLENRLPDTYAAFTGSNSFSIDARASDYANCQVTVTLMDIDGNVDATINAYDITPTANNTWQTKTVEPGSAYVAGEGIIIRVRVISLDSADTVDVGRIKVSYKAVR